MRLKRIGMLLLALTLAFAMLGGTAYAAAPPVPPPTPVPTPIPPGGYSITVEARYDATPVEGMTFKLYKIATVDEYGAVTPTQSTAGTGVLIPAQIEPTEAWRTAFNTLAGYAADLDLAGSKATGADGKLTFDKDLEMAIYLIIGQPLTVGNVKYTAAPVWTQLPVPKTDPPAWDHNPVVQVVKPKLEKISPDPVTVQVKKVWIEDKPAHERYRPAELTVELLKDGVVDPSKTQKLTAAKGWTYTWSDLPGGFAWTVREVVPEHYRQTGKDTQGTLTTITNTLDAIFVDPPIRKVVDPKGAPSAPFEFQMKAIRGPVTPIPMPEGSTNGVKTKTITGAGDDEFGEFPLYVEGTYEYEISEVAGSAPGYTYDTNKYTLTVEVKRVNGVLTKTEKVKSTKDPTEHVRAETERFVFTNTYTQTSPNVVELSLGVSKVLKGSPKTTADFELRLVGKNGAPMPSGTTGSQKTVKIHGQGSASFGAMTYSAPGRYVYEVSEVNAKLIGYTYDTTVYTVTVDVTQKTDGTLSVDVSAVNNHKQSVKWDELVFTNTYKEPAPQTGILWWPVPVLLAGGLLLTFAGLLRRKYES